MANTSNLGLAKLDGTEKLKTFPTTFNGDMDTIDTVVGNDVGTSRTISQAITKTEEGIAIVANGNTHSAISSGQYVYVKNHGSLAEGLYTASSAISANATLSGSNLTAVSGGGLNSVYSALNGNIATVRSELGKFKLVHEQYCSNENYIDIDFSDSKFVPTGVFMVTLNYAVAFILKISDGIHLLGVLTPSDYSHLTYVTDTYKLRIFSGQWYRWARVYQINIGST